MRENPTALRLGVGGPGAAEATIPPAVPAAPPTAMIATIVMTVAPNTVATAQVTNPLAVSRKNTSCVCSPTHFVRSRPVRYPPIPDEIQYSTTSHPAVTAVNAVPEAPRPAQGDTAVSPKPAPSVISISPTETAANAPASTADHPTPEP